MTTSSVCGVSPMNMRDRILSKIFGLTGSEILDCYLGPKDYVVVIDDGVAYPIHKNRVTTTDIVATKESRWGRAKRFTKALNKELQDEDQ